MLGVQHEAEEAKKQVKALQGELDGVTYTAESVNGRRLRARLITWQKENDELAAQVSEGTVHKLECELALLKDYLTDVKRADHELVCAFTLVCLPALNELLLVSGRWMPRALLEAPLSS
jgi:hypothetical protein